MTSGTRAGLYNVALASLAAAAAAFAAYSMPEQFIRAETHSAGLSEVPHSVVRAAMTMVAAIGAFLVSWLPLFACDLLRRVARAVPVEDAAPTSSRQDGGQGAQPGIGEITSSKDIEASPEPAGPQQERSITPGPPLNVRAIRPVDSWREATPAVKPSSESPAGLVQRIDAAFSQHERLVRSEREQQYDDEVDDQLRDVLQSLKTRIRQGERQG